MGELTAIVPFSFDGWDKETARKYAYTALAKLDGISKIYVSGIDLVEYESVGEFENLSQDNLLNALAKKTNGTLLYFNPMYKNITQETVKEAIHCFEETNPSVLACQDRKGTQLEAITIITKEELFKEHVVLHDMGNSYVFMLDLIQTVQATPTQPEAQTGREAYDTQEQLELAIKYIDNIGDHYDTPEDDINDPVLLRSKKDVPQRVKILQSIPHGMSILDIGCSAGVITVLLAQTCDEVVGVDIVPKLIDDANARLEKLPDEIKKRVNFICADIANLNLEKNHFDSAYFTEFFEHIPHVKRDDILIQSISYLNEDGNVVISVPNRYPKDEYVAQKRHRWDWYNHLTHFTRRSLEYWVGQYFKQVEFLKIYDQDSVEQGIWLVCIGRGKK